MLLFLDRLHSLDLERIDKDGADARHTLTRTRSPVRSPSAIRPNAQRLLPPTAGISWRNGSSQKTTCEP